MKELILSNDKYKMNWVEGATEWGTVRAPKELSVSVSSERDGDIVREEYVFTNTTEKTVFTSLRDIGIYTPFNDDYTDSATCVTNRCHTHIRCGEDVSYIMALRMGGDAPHLGLVMTDGSIGGYSVERDISRMSNDRGDFILHPSPTALAPGGSMRIAWTLFPHEGKADFETRLSLYNKDHISINAEQYIVFLDERIHIELKKASGAENIKITRGGCEVGYTERGGVITIEEQPLMPGEYRYDIDIDGIRTHCTVLVQLPPWELAKRRAGFIADNQQYIKENSHLDGAYLIYDNEEEHMYYSTNYDKNAARERIGMALAMTKYLQHNADERLMKSLLRYVAFAEREIIDTRTGLVTNDYMYDDTYKRLYNYPWYALFELELYALLGNKDHLVAAYRIMRSFYEQGGAHFYAIEIPIRRILKMLADAGMGEERAELLEHFRAHAEFIIGRGLLYPPHEVNYEQSIAAPAANILIELYLVTGEEKYLEGARVQMRGLEAFNGIQPDYHLYEVAIRHWDGFWFGKRRLYGDTFPHYWSALTAIAYAGFAEATGDSSYLARAEAAHRGVLSMIFPDGTASCAYVYPASVNGAPGGFFDPYANDQDWGLYFMLRYMEQR